MAVTPDTQIGSDGERYPTGTQPTTDPGFYAPDFDLSDPSDNDVLTYDAATGKYGPEPASGGGGGLSDVVEDLTPQLGGNLDVNGKDITSPDGTDLIDIVNGAIDLQTNSASRLHLNDSGMQLGGANARVTTVLDQDDMSGDSATALATQQSIKAYVDNEIAAIPAEWSVAASDETTAITTGTAKVTFRMPFAMTLTAVRASLTTASTSGVVTVDINEGGSTILSTKLTIDQDEKTSTSAATPAVISDAALADDAEMTIDIDGAGTGATGLKVLLIGTRA